MYTDEVPNQYARLTPAQRFWAKVDPCRTDGEMLWIGYAQSGYGAFSVCHHYVRAHRWIYEQKVGPITKGFELDHVFSRGCRHTNCVNWEHLEPVTHRVNSLRGKRGQLNDQTHCKRGHEFTEANTYLNSGQRFCRACGRERTRAYLLKKRSV